MQGSPFKGRREDPRLLTGRGRYSADCNLAGQLHACFLRADRAHAEIAALRIEEALKSPGVVAVLTGEDTAGLKTPPPLVKYPGKGGMQLKVPHREVLARGRVRFVGQEVALVVATSAAAAQDAAERIEVEYRDLPAVVDAEDALAAGAPQLHDAIAGNLCFEYEYGDAAATEAAFKGAAHVARLTLDAQRLVGNPMEPKSCLASYDAASGTFDLYASNQGMTLTLGCLTGVFGLPAEKFRVQMIDVGGGFGIRSDAYPEYCAVLLAAKKLGRPVKWVGSRSETMLTDYHGRGAKLAGELALDREGRFLGVRFLWTVNAGAYLSQPGPLINTLNPASHSVNAYRIPAVHGIHRLAITNTAPTTAYRGAGRPNVSYIVERLVDEAARLSGIDRIELRRRNLIPKEAFPYKTPTSVYDSGDPPGELEKVLRLSEWNTFEKRRKDSKKLRGIGCAVFIEPAGAGAHPLEEAAIKFGDSGNASIYAMAGPSGQGHETVFPQVVAEVLGMDEAKIELRASDPLGPKLAGEGTIGSRSMMAHGGAFVMAAREAIRKGTALAAKELEAAAQDIEFSGGAFKVKGTDLAVRIEVLAKRYPGQLDSQGGVPPTRSFPGGAHVAEVEVDPETGAVQVLRYVAVDDCGRVINHALLEGQVHGGIAQGAGQILVENCVYERASGQLLTATFMDYAMPRADELPGFELADHSVPAPGNPLGVKGAGEAGTTGAVPALANAVIDALRPLGVHHLDAPYTPKRVWQAIRRAKG